MIETSAIKTILIGVIIVCLFGTFWLSFLIRPIQSETFEITVANKDPNKGLLEYRDEIRQFLIAHRFVVEHDTQNKLIAHPRGLYQVRHTPFTVTIDAYSIHIKGPKNLLRQMLSHLELLKIFGAN